VAAFCRHHHKKMNVFLARTGEQWRGAFLVGARCQVRQHGIHAFRVRAGGLRCFLCATQLSRGHHLHGLGDLARRLDGRDAVSEIF
jgi:hypothetical protein